VNAPGSRFQLEDVGQLAAMIILEIDHDLAHAAASLARQNTADSKNIRQLRD
jgi:hypothetical protein